MKIDFFLLNNTNNRTMSRKRFIPCMHPIYDMYIAQSNDLIRAQQRARKTYEELFQKFQGTFREMEKRTPVELKDPANGRIFFCEVKNFSSEKEKINYLNQPGILPIHLYPHNSNDFEFYKRIMFSTDRIIKILKSVEKEHIDDAIYWTSSSIFEFPVFHGSTRTLYYFDEEFFLKQVIHCLMDLHRGKAPHPKIMEAFTVTEKNNVKSLRICI